VESLLRFDKRGSRFIEQPALDVAAKMIAHEKPESWQRSREFLESGSYACLALDN
jgi:hypothetical protein